jgi:gamma-glutamyltranspeptidase/glutathione hydrolase
MDPAYESRRSAVYAAGGMVATSQPLAARAGVAILERGGNAADAAIAAAAALAVTEPTSCGLGGDCFAMFYDEQRGRITALNGSGRAPAALTIDRVRADGLKALPTLHGHTVTVPGAVAAFCDLHARHGKTPLADLLAPAVALADGGFPVAPITAHFWKLGADSVLSRSHGGAQLLIDGRAPRPGEMIRNRALASTLRRIAADGAPAFYTGEVAERIVAAVAAAGGALSLDDLEAHASIWQDPISTVYRGTRVFECPPNGQGLTALLALNILRHRDVASLDPLGADRLHEIIEALRLAFADTRYYVADPDAVHVPVRELLGDDYAASRAALIDRTRALADPVRGTPTGGSNTVYLSAADASGNACSLIFSNYMGFGTGIVPDKLGFPLQNRGHGFSLDPDHPNSLAPRKRPYHTIIPGMATREDDGSLYASFGVMGGFMQPQGHVQVMLALLDDGLDPQQALDRPRVCLPAGEAKGLVALEAGIAPSVVDELRARGHDVALVEGHGRAVFGRGQIITRDPESGVLCGGSDPRADGCAIGL